MDVLPPTPSLPAPDGGLPAGLTAGTLRDDPVVHQPTGGRVRRWSYAAAGDDERAVGAAVVDLGVVGTVFLWALLDGRVHTWERTRPLGIGCRVGREPTEPAMFGTWPGGAAGRRDTVGIGGDGSLSVDVRLGRGRPRLRARLTAGTVTPAVLVTATAAGGWNATQKAAGYEVTGEIALGEDRWPLVGAGWRDWTAGRQDRHTVWRWVAAAGRSRDGRRVGINASTGMNALAEGEDVVWWDGVPYRLDVRELHPTGDDPAGAWTVAGDGWSLRFEARGARAADEDWRLLVSRYVQPIGRLTGTLPGPDGTAVDVTLTGVTEDHEARW